MTRTDVKSVEKGTLFAVKFFKVAGGSSLDV